MASEIRLNSLKNRVGLGTVSFADTGIIVSGIVTCTELSGLTALNIAGVGTANTLDINGDIDVDGHTELDRMRVTGVSTFTNFIEAGSVGSGGIKVGSNLFIQDQGNVLIQNTGNGSMYLKSLGTSLRDRNNNTIINASEASGARLYHTGGSTQKLGTSATGINILEDLDVDGHTNLDNVSIAGVTTFTKQGGVLNQTNPVIVLRSSTNTQMRTNFILEDDYPSGRGSLSINVSEVGVTNDRDLLLQRNGGRTSVGPGDPSTTLHVFGTSTFAGAIDANGDLDVDGHTNLDNVSIAGITTFSGDVQIDGDELFIADSIKHTGDTNTSISFPSNDTIRLMTSGDGRLIIDSSGRLLMGHTASHHNAGHHFRVQVSGTNFPSSGISQQRFENVISGASLILSHSRNSTQGNHTILNVNDEFGKIRFYGSDGTDFECYGAAIVAKVETGISGNNTPGRLEFHTNTSGKSADEKLRITSAGVIETKTRSAEVRRMILSGSPTNSSFNIEAHDGETGESSGDVQGKLGLFYNDGTTLTNTSCISFIRGSGAPDGAMAFVTNQNERLRILSNGNTDFYTNEVRLYNNVDTSNTYFYAQNTGAGNAGVRIKNQDGEWTIIANDALRFRDEEANADRLRILSDGTIFVNGTTVSAGGADPKLIVSSDTSSNLGIIQIHAGGGETSGDLSGITFSHGQYNEAARPKASIALEAIGSYGIGDLCFYVDGAADNNTVSAGDKKLTLTRAGQLVVQSGGIDFNTAGTGAFYNPGASDAAGINFYSNEIRFYTQNTERFKLDTGGSLRLQQNFFLRTTAPTIYLQDTDHHSAMIHQNSGLFYVLRGAGTDSTSWVQYNGQWPLYIRMDNNKAYFGSSVYSAGTLLTGSSDLRLKKNLVKIQTPLEKISKLTGYNFDWNDNVIELGFTPDIPTNDVGLIAQDVQEVAPQAVQHAPFDQVYDKETKLQKSKSGENYLTVQYEKLVPLLVEAIKELKAEVDALKSS